MNYNTAMNQISKYKYALLYNYSTQILCRTDELDSEDWEECMEAYVFDESGELHIFPQEKIVYEIFDENHKKYSDIQYKLQNNYQKYGSVIVVRRYLEQDEDGQTYISQTRLLDIRREK